MHLIFDDDILVSWWPWPKTLYESWTKECVWCHWPQGVGLKACSLSTFVPDSQWPSKYRYTQYYSNSTLECLGIWIIPVILVIVHFWLMQCYIDKKKTVDILVLEGFLHCTSLLVFGTCLFSAQILMSPHLVLKLSLLVFHFENEICLDKNLTFLVLTKTMR